MAKCTPIYFKWENFAPFIKGIDLINNEEIFTKILLVRLTRHKSTYKLIYSDVIYKTLNLHYQFTIIYYFAMEKTV